MKICGHVGLSEPFKGLFTQGMVVHETYRNSEGGWVSPAEIRIDETDGKRTATMLDTNAAIKIGAIEKMSKSKRNIVDPDEILDTYGADTARWFVLSDSPPERDVIWSEAGVEGSHRFVQRIWRLVNNTVALNAEKNVPNRDDLSEQALEILKITHKALSKTDAMFADLRFNNAYCPNPFAGKLAGAKC